jgi:hypothetical protein
MKSDIYPDHAELEANTVHKIVAAAYRIKQQG